MIHDYGESNNSSQLCVTDKSEHHYFLCLGYKKVRSCLKKSKNAEVCYNSLSEIIKTAEVQMWRSDWSQKLLRFLRQSKRAV